MKQDLPTQRATLARELLEAGVPEPAIVRRLQVRFNVVRSTAYLDIRKAIDEIARDDDGPAESEAIDTEGMIAALLYDAQLCQEAGNYVAMQQCIRSADTLRRWGGMAARL